MTRRKNILGVLVGGLLIASQLFACPFDYFITEQRIVMSGRRVDLTDSRYLFPAFEKREKPLKNALGESPDSERFHIGALLSVVHRRNLGIGEGLDEYRAILGHLLGISPEKVSTQHVSDPKGKLQTWVLQQFAGLDAVRPPLEFTDESFDVWIAMVVDGLKTEYVDVIPLKKSGKKKR